MKKEDKRLLNDYIKRFYIPAMDTFYSMRRQYCRTHMAYIGWRAIVNACEYVAGETGADACQLIKTIENRMPDTVLGFFWDIVVDGAKIAKKRATQIAWVAAMIHYKR